MISITKSFAPLLKPKGKDAKERMVVKAVIKIVVPGPPQLALSGCMTCHVSNICQNYTSLNLEHVHILIKNCFASFKLQGEDPPPSHKTRL